MLRLRRMSIISLSVILSLAVISCTAKYKREEQALQNQIDNCKKQLDAEISKENGMQKQILALQKQLADFKSKYDAGNEKIAGMQRRIDELTQQLTAEKSQAAKTQIQLNGLQSQYDAGKERQTGMQKKIDDLTQQLAAERAKSAEIQKQLDALNNQLSAQKAEALKEQKSNEAAYQKLLKDLKDEIQKDEISIQQYKDMLVINVAEKVLFDLGRAEIKPQYYPILNKIGKILKEQSDKFIQIEGHTDDIPIAAEYQWKIPNNWALGARRAINVTIYFTDHFNIDPKMIGVMSFSKYRPLVPNINAANRAKNRRIEIILLGQSLYKQLYKKGM